MTLTASNKLQLLWDHFIHAESQSYEKSSWLDIFLAELLAQVHEGRDTNEILSFCSDGGSGVSTLVACEILSDIHDLCTTKNDGGELIELGKYLIQGRGWRSLAVLHLLGVRGLSCGRELVALLVALYPVALQEATELIPHNPYIKFYSNDDIVDTIDIISHTKKRYHQYNRSNIINDTQFLHKRSCQHSITSTRTSGNLQSIREKSMNEKSNRQNNTSSESDGECTNEIDQAKSLTLKIRLNPMDFEYFTRVVRSDEEEDWPSNIHRSIKLRQQTDVPQNFIDQRIKTVLETKINNFETSILIIQLLQTIKDYNTNTEKTSVVQVLKFALDTMWSLQFSSDAMNFTNIECATLKAAAARLMLTTLERVLKADEPTTAVIHNGLLPMTLRLVEDACSKPLIVISPEEGILLQEFIFATTYGIVSFLYCLFHQRAVTKKLDDFLELFQLFIESQDGKLIERTIMKIIELPTIDPSRSTTRARKVIDIIGALISTLKHVRQQLCNMEEQCHRPKHHQQHTNDSDTVEIYHHNDILGIAYCESIVASIPKQACCVSSLFIILIALIKESHLFQDELQIRLLKVITATGTCCCFSPKILLINVVNFMKMQKNNQQIYSSCVALLERCLYRELGAVSSLNNNCNICIKPSSMYSWDFLQLYESLLTPSNSNLCYTIMAHLLRITPATNFHIKHEMFFKIFYPTLIKFKRNYTQSKYDITIQFIIQSCLSIISSLIIDSSIYNKFMKLNGLQEVLELLSRPMFTRNICNILEVSVIMEISKKTDDNNEKDVNISDGVAMNIIFEILENKITDLLCALEVGKITRDRRENTDADMEKLDHIKEKLDHLKNKLSNNKSIKNTQIKIDKKLDEMQIINFFHICAAWRMAANIALCSPKFRIELSKNPLAKKLLRALEALAISIATDRIVIDSSKSAQRLLEALITCCLISPLCNCDVIGHLSKALMNSGVTLGRKISIFVEALLRVALIKPSPEQTILKPARPRLPTMAPESPPDCGGGGGGDDSSAGEYVTADDGYEADIETQGKSSGTSPPKQTNSFGPLIEPRRHATAHPALCSLAVDLLIHFIEQGLDDERCTIVSGGLRKVVITCRESASSCAVLAGSGTISRLLSGFESILISKDLRYSELQHAILDVFTLLAMQSISSAELLNYLSLFKVKSPPLLSLLQPLFRLVHASRPQPNFILSFPTVEQTNIYSIIKNDRNDDRKSNEKTENLVNNLRKKHSTFGVCSPWSVHAVCLPIGPELSWSVWSNGCSASMWIRIERGSLLNGRGTNLSVAPVFDNSSESLSEWGILSDNWSKEVVMDSSSPPTPATIVHFFSIGFESLVLEMWFDLQSDKLIFRLTRPDEKINRTVSETSINGMLSAGRWHNLSFNLKDTILNKRNAVIELVMWIDGWQETTVKLPFDGLLIRKPGTSCLLLGQVGSNQNGAWYLGNLMLFRLPIFTKERALYLTSLGPNYTNLADCILNTPKSNFAPLLVSGALNGIREFKFDDGKFDITRRKSYGGTYFRHVVETKIFDSKIDWATIMDATNSYLCELQDNILLCYEAQSPNIVNLYPQAIAHPSAVVRSLFPGQPGFRVISAPDHRVSQQPPLSIAIIAPIQLERQQYRGFIPAVSSIGGIPIFLYLFARVVELNSTEEEQALALSIILHLVRSDSDLLCQYNSEEDGLSLLLRVLESPRCHAGKYMLKAIFDAACDSPIIVKDITNDNHIVLQNSEAIIIDPVLISESLSVWKTWIKYDALNMFLQAILILLRDQHSQREFNATQLNRAGIVETILLLCKQHFIHENLDAIWDTTTGNAIVELIRALMGAPPDFSHLVAIMNYLVLVHQASNTYITHSRHNIYFLLPKLMDENKINVKLMIPTSQVTETKQTIDTASTKRTMTTAKISTANTSRHVSSSDDSSGPLEISKINKALENVQIQRDRVMKKRERRINNDKDGGVVPSKDMSAGEDSGIAASDGSNHHISKKYLSWTDEKRACQGLVCEGLLLILRDALRVLPDNQVLSVLKNVIRAELLLVLVNDPDARVRTAIIKVIQAYFQRASDEDINKFMKQKYFFHLANQISQYSGCESLISALENLAARGPILSAMPPLLAMLTKCAATEPNIARPIVSFITDVITKNQNALRSLLDQGLAECLGQALVGGAHKGNSTSLLNDIHVLLLAIATKLLESPGNHQIQAISDLHLILNYLELHERNKCGTNVACVSIIRAALVVLFDGELDALMSKMSKNPGFKLRSAASYLASASYLTTILTTSSDQSDQESRSASYTSVYSSGIPLREPGRGEINERFRTILFRAVEFITTADRAPTNNELELTKKLFTILLHGLSTPYDRKNYWSGSWSSRPTLKKNTAKMMLWLLGPHQSNNIRVFAVRSLMEELRGREILSSLLEIHPQIEQKFTVYFWDLLQKCNDMPSSDAQLCIELKEALSIWELVKGINNATPKLWSEELTLLRHELVKDREIWMENNLSAIHRIGNKFDLLAKQLIDSAMIITQSIIEQQNCERKIFMEKLKHSRAMEAQAMEKWRDLTKRLTHERAPWHFPESYPRSWELDPTEGPARIRIRMQRCHLKIDKRFMLDEHQAKLDAANIEGPLSYLFTTVRKDVNTTALIKRLHTSERIRKMSQACVVTPRAESSGKVLIGETCLYFVPDNPDIPIYTDIGLGGLDLAMAGGTAWRLENIREIHCRRYQLQERAIEIFLTTGRTYLLAFNSSKDRDNFTSELSMCNLPQRIPGDDLDEALALWRSGNLTNWEYVMCLNKLAGRSYNDLMQYPVFPFVLSDYISERINLKNSKIYRDFKRPMAVQDKKNEQHYINNYNYLKQALIEGHNLIALNQEPFHYGSHYSNSGTVLHFLVRLPPFTSMFLCYQDNNFDIPDRTFHALATTWRLTSCDSTTDVKELIPEFFYLPEFLINFEGFNFGMRQNGCQVGDVELPPWSHRDARLFVLAHRAALESDIVRENLPYWIDLVFGFRQTGKPAIEAINVFHPATYYGFNVDEITDPLVRQASETMVKTYGQTPAQLFTIAHPLPILNAINTYSFSNIPSVIEEVEGIKWGNYVGAPGNEPILCWKHKNRIPMASLIPLFTGDVYGLPICTTLLLGYNHEKGSNMLNSISVLAAALASWNNNDGIVRLKSKKVQPPKPLIQSCGFDPITIIGSAADCGQLWLGHFSGRITVYSYNIETIGKIEFTSGPASILLAHRSAIQVIALSRAFSIGVSGDNQGIIVIWDLNSLSYVRSIICNNKSSINHLAISETLGDIALTCQLTETVDDNNGHRSELQVFTINARPVGSVLSRRKITALCYSNAPEGVSVNVIATGLDNGVIRLWSSWDLRLVREIVNGGKDCGGIIAIAWALDQHHLYAATEDSTVLIWEGIRRLSNGTPKFVNSTSL
ncbi:hypothetical protein PV328_009113 [Microctonus aethiopoides]|uniref:Lysosomal-trafficking regulator n=1 Tax=Microctonus aethiopoides TaxID=144406 RepID=A0AA39KRT2_9HYME|nr:hypothetical protein PV328_009113 [Microctonus aethiopoides]